MTGGDTYHWGDHVTINGGSNNTGIDKRQFVGTDPNGASAELQQAITELTRLLRELRPQVDAVDAEVIDDSLAELESGPADPRRRRGVLLTLAGVASTVGAVGRPVADIVSQVLSLMSGR